MVIRRVKPLSCAKVAGVIYALMGLIGGLLMSVAFMGLGTAMGEDSQLGAVMGGMMGIGSIIVLPIVYGVLGFILTAIAAFLYNIVAGVVGGIEIEVDTPPAAVTPTRAPLPTTGP
jgi:hypothetical protein